MKALVYKRYGPPAVLHLQELEKPQPAADQILVQIHATTVNRTDTATIKAIPWFARIITGLLRPKKQIPGTAFAGIVETVGDQVTEFKAGERVFGFDDTGAMAHAEYTVITEDKLATIPDNITFAEAAASPEGAHYAYNFMNKVDLQVGQSVLVNGATGAIGSAGVQLLKHFKATVTAVCSSEGLDKTKSLGADRIIDYTTTDFTQQNEQYDYVFDMVGKSSFFKCMKILKPGGVYFSSDLGFLAQNLYLPLVTSLLKPLFGMKRILFPMPVDIKGTLLLIRGLLESREYRPLLDREYSLDEIIDAYRYVELGHKKGNVVVRVIE